MGEEQMRTRLIATIALVACLTLLASAGGASLAADPVAEAASGPSLLADDPNPPASTVKLIFIHHSTGEGWLGDANGRLGIALRDNNYFVSDTNYGWGPNNIGDRTDIGNWYEWFAGSSRNTYMNALYAESGQHCDYSRLASDPRGQNQIILFKSCFPNSDLEGNPNDPPTTGTNPLRGKGCCDADHNVANAKGIYNDILAYFRTRQGKLFVLIVTPPLDQGATSPGYAANARALSNWLVNDWLDGYPYQNVAVFDYFNVLTSNGGNPNVNDLGAASTGNHHRFRNGAVEHVQHLNNNYAAYSVGGDSHPTAAGQQKATGEFVALLNVFYRRWQASPGRFSAPALWYNGYGRSAGGWTSQDAFPRLLGDVDGDGQADVVGFQSSGTYVSLSTGTAFGSQALWVASYDPNAGGWSSQNLYPRMLGDVDGDGMADVVGFGSRGTYVSLSTGATFTAPALWIANYGTRCGGWASQDQYPRFVADVDGDGKADVVGFGAKGVYVSLSTGSGFAAPVRWIADYGCSAGGWSSQDIYPRAVADVDGDGRADVVGFGSAGAYVSLSTGTAFGPLVLRIAQYGQSAAAGSWTSQNIYPRAMADVSGGGKADIVGFANGGMLASLMPFPPADPHANHPARRAPSLARYERRHPCL